VCFRLGINQTYTVTPLLSNFHAPTPKKSIKYWRKIMSFLSLLFGPSVPKLTANDVNEKLKFGKHPMVIDVRQPEEFRLGHITGSKLIPLSELRKRIKELPQGREIICVCASGSRSGSAAKFLLKEGYTVFDMQGGMHAWRLAKLPIQKS
jgi:rhodanese-related sulfurtransferase